MEKNMSYSVRFSREIILNSYKISFVSKQDRLLPGVTFKRIELMIRIFMYKEFLQENSTNLCRTIVWVQMQIKRKINNFLFSQSVYCLFFQST